MYITSKYVCKKADLEDKRAAEIARSSNNVHACTLFDSEFWLKPKYRSYYNHRHP